MLGRAKRERPRVAWQPGAGERVRPGVVRLYARHVRPARTLAAQSVLLKVATPRGAGRVRPVAGAAGEGTADVRPAGPPRLNRSRARHLCARDRRRGPEARRGRARPVRAAPARTG